MVPQHALEITRHYIEGEFPRITFVCHQRLHHAEDLRLASVPVVLQRAREGRDMRKLLSLGQELRDFGIGIRAFLKLAVELQEKLPAIDHRGIALLHPQHVRGKGGFVFLRGRF